MILEKRRFCFNAHPRGLLHRLNVKTGVGRFNMSGRKKYDGDISFGSLMHSMNQFFHEKPIKSLLQTIDEFFANPFPPSSFYVERKETDKEYIVLAELPGVKKEQIQLDIYDRYMTISVQYEEELTEENTQKQTVKRQHSFQKTSRTISFPFQLDEHRMRAAYENGLLQIRVAKPKGKRMLIE